ncbi:MAG: hypothetical protein WCA49_20665, partial [Candidatus Sulfotelmatobacter sp.]
MAEAVPNTQHEFWKPPSVLEPTAATLPSAAAQQEMAEVCAGCGREFLIGARFCHTCGLNRPARATTLTSARTDAEFVAGLWARNVDWVRAGVDSAAAAWRNIPFPDWLRYLHFHEIKRWVG